MKKRLIKLGIGAVLFIVALLINVDNKWIKMSVFLPAILIIGGDVLLRALRNILRGRIFDENFLMSVAAIGAFCIAEYPEAVAVMLFYQVGETFQKFAVDKSRKSIASLMNIRPDFANVKQGDELIKKDPEDVSVSDIVVICPGERIPLDCKIIDGASAIDSSALTGESMPRDVNVGDEILSGCININGTLTAEVQKIYAESTVARILDLVENAGAKKSKSEAFISKFASVYTPIVVIVAALLALIPPLAFKADWNTWIYRALTFLVVSCPCALVVSIPMSFFGGLGGASRRGILIKGSVYLESLGKVDTVVFDKTGTLTRGIFEVKSIIPQLSVDSRELLCTAAYAESYSTHPIAASIKKAYGDPLDISRISESENLPGLGIKTVFDGDIVFAGNGALMQSIGIVVERKTVIGTSVYVAKCGKYLGEIVIADTLRDDSAVAIHGLKDAGVKNIVMLTGDVSEVANNVAAEIGIGQVYSELLPNDKVEKLEELLVKNNSNKTLAFVGDGINDAPALARADIGIAMGGLGSDAALEAADVVLMTDEPSKLIEAIEISKRTLNIARVNAIFAIGIKMLVLSLSAIGIVSMWIAVFADVGVCLLAVLNAFRALGIKKKARKKL